MSSKSLPLILSVVALATAGTALAYRAGVAGSRGGATGGDEALGSEVLELREQVASLTDRLARLESREVLQVAAQAPRLEMAPARISAAPGIDDETLEEVRSVAAALAGDGASANQLEELVLGVVEQRELAKEEARQEEARQRMEERTQEQVARLVEDLGLDKYQEDQLWKLVDSQTERREGLMEIFESRDMARMGEARDEMRAMRTEYDESFQGFLTEAQIEQYEELGRRSSPFSGGGWGGGGGRRGGGN
jgi:hypothetical protein